MRWLKQEPRTRPAGKSGRRPTPDQIRDLILALARENASGYTRILDKLKKLGMGRVCRSTVVNILKAHGLDPGPRRGEGSWDQFVQSHLKTLWACDFFTQRVLTFRGGIEYYLLLFVHLDSRRLFISPATLNPTTQWVQQQARPT